MPAKAAIPIKVRFAVLHGGANVTQPQRAKRIVVQQVFAENSQMVFRAEHSNIHIIKLSDTRTFKQIVEGTIVQMSNPVVNVNVVLTARILCTRYSCGVLFGSNHQVYVAIRPQTGFGIEPGGRPALHQYRLDSHGRENRQHLFDRVFA